MSLRLKNKQHLTLICYIYTGWLILTVLFFTTLETGFLTYDYKFLDHFYKLAVKHGYGPVQSQSPKIRYVTITDHTYAAIGTTFLDRSFLTKVNNVLKEFDPQSVAYDIIFARPSAPDSDAAFASSIQSMGNVYLPIGFKLEEQPAPFAWESNTAFDKLQSYLANPYQSGESHVYSGSRVLMQYSMFAKAATGSGHISSLSDPDRVSRHMLMVIKVKDKLFPCLSLAMFLDYVEVPFADIEIAWGRHVRIPASPDSYLEKDVIIPIDNHGRAYVPFVQTWEKGFAEMPAHELLENAKDENLAGNLLEIFEGNFVFIGDISMGISDLGNTPLQNDVPLVVLHTSMLNALLTGQFYTGWSDRQVMALIIGTGMLLALSAMPRGSWLPYLACSGLIAGTLLLTWVQFVHFNLLPVFTVTAACLILFFALIFCLGIATARDRTYIRSIFARYVPEKVVNHLLLNPNDLKLGGEIREISLLMSDLRGFTALAAIYSPEEIIRMLNQYFERMVTIIQAHNGVIDEFIGDGILAFFGAPEPDETHCENAVACALAMQAAMEGINNRNYQDGLPRLNMGIAVNTGEVVLGNIGSEKRAKYGVVGSEVNYTGRAESCTVGGQVLITQSVFDRLENILTVKKRMAVKMKGAPRPACLYDVIGIEGAYTYSLPQHQEQLVKLTEALPVRLYMLDEKMVSDSGIPAWIISLGDPKAKIIVPEPLKEFVNIKLRLAGPDEENSEDSPGTVPAEIYAKVMSCKKTGEDYDARLHFTYVSQSAEKLLKAI